MKTYLCKIISIFTILLSLSNINAQTAEEYFMLGNNAYKNGQYQKAVQNYESAIEAGLDGAQIRFNLANASAKIDDNAKALVNYMKSIYESPRMREATANLEVFANDIGLDTGLSQFSSSLITELSYSEWVVVAFLSFWAAILLIFLPPLFGKRTMPTIFLSIVCSVVFVLSLIAIKDWYNFANIVVSIKSDVSLRLSPTQTAPTSAIIEAGQIASIKNENDNFIYIETSNGKKGWANKDNFEGINTKF